MAVYHKTTISCACGQRFSANLARSINAARTPAVRETIMRGEFHQVTCPACGRAAAVESPFYYLDLTRNAVYLVRPRSKRFDFRRDSVRLGDSAGAVPNDLASGDPRQLRVVYGLDELREKLVAQDGELDDRTVELLKVYALHEHPFLLQKPRLLIHLTDVNSASIDLAAYYHHGADRFRIRFPRATVDDVLSRESELRAWAAKTPKGENLFELTDHWVNFRRWSSRYSALDALRGMADGIEAGQKPGLGTPQFKKMIAGLPRGSDLPPWAKADLATLFEYAKSTNRGDAEDKLFEVRFGIELEDEWSRNKDKGDIGVMWQLLRSLPPSNVDGNTKIVKLLLDKGEGGGSYGNDTIDIGEDELDDRERFEDTLRHEVGHAVHEQRDSIVSPWLEKNFGWRLLPKSASGIDQWIKLMGGWGPLSPKERSEVTQYLSQAVGPGASWKSGPRPVPPKSHPWWGKAFGPRLAYEKSGTEDWYTQFKNWYRVGNRAFALNYWYAAFMVVDTATLDLVAKMPDNYAAMSHYEFFAELYALYYDVDDPKRKVIPPAISKWLDANIGKRDPKNPTRPVGRRKPSR